MEETSTEYNDTLYHNPSISRVILQEFDISIMPKSNVDFSEYAVPWKEIKGHPEFKFLLRKGFLKEGKYEPPKKPEKKDDYLPKSVSLNPTARNDGEQIVFAIERRDDKEFNVDLENMPGVDKSPKLAKMDNTPLTTDEKKIFNDKRDEEDEASNKNFRDILMNSDKIGEQLGIENKSHLVESLPVNASEDDKFYSRQSLNGKTLKELKSICSEYEITKAYTRSKMTEAILEAQKKKYE